MSRFGTHAVIFPKNFVMKNNVILNLRILVIVEYILKSSSVDISSRFIKNPFLPATPHTH